MSDMKHRYGLKRVAFLIMLMLLALEVTYAQSPGDFVADSGFRPEVDGFGFENYGEGNNDLTAIEVQRMFGDVVCYDGSVQNEDGCDLTPTAQMWMEETNQNMSGGHCEGMAALSWLFYTGMEATDEFGGGATSELELDGNDPLQREIAYWWATQMTNPTDTDVIYGAPSEIVNTLVDSMNEETETYTVGIYMRDGEGGHAITPFAVTDQGDGIYWIMVYDNNWPGEERYLEVDTNNETWQYNAAINPNEPESLYEGDAETKTLSLTPTSPRLEIQECPFCGDAGSSDGYTGVSINAKGARLTVTDDKGNVTGYQDGKWVNNIPGAKMIVPKNIFIRGVLPPQILFPNGSPFKITATQGPNTPPDEKATFLVVRSGSITKVGGIELDDTEDTLNVDGSSIQYTSGNGGETLIIDQGVTSDGNDYRYTVEGHGAMGDGGTVDFSFDPENGGFNISGSEANEYSMSVDRIDEEGNATNFFTDNLEVGAGETADLNAGEWQDGDQITGDITGADGSEIGPIDLQDEQGSTDVDSTDTSNEEPTVEAPTNEEPTEVGSDAGSGDQGGDSGSGGEEAPGDDSGGG